MAVAGTGVFFGVQLTLFNNFIVERLGIEPHELGYVEALREVPGFLNAFFLALIVRCAPPKVAAVSLVVMGIGLAAYSEVSSVFMLASFSLVWSLGFHCWLPLEQSMGLAYGPTADKGRWLGQLRSISSLAWLVAIGVCMVGLDFLRYEGVFVLAGVCTAAGGLALFWVDNKAAPAGEKRLVLKRRYLLFYALVISLQGRAQADGCISPVSAAIPFAPFARHKSSRGAPVEIDSMVLTVEAISDQSSSPLTASWDGRLVGALASGASPTRAPVIAVVLVFVFIGLPRSVSTGRVLYALYASTITHFPFGGIAR